ncbi:MAG TPA: hypothetical protein VGM95_00885 [Lactobacillaceae bacterium]|jgi:hypothetical protein
MAEEMKRPRLSEKKTPKNKPKKPHRRIKWRWWLIGAVAIIVLAGAAYLTVQYMQQVASLNASKTQTQVFNKNDDTDEKSIKARQAFEKKYFKLTTENGHDIPADLSTKKIDQLEAYVPNIGKKYRDNYEKQIQLLRDELAVQKAYFALLTDPKGTTLKDGTTTQTIYDFNKQYYDKLTKIQAEDDGNKFAPRMINVQTTLGQDARNVDSLYSSVNTYFTKESTTSIIVHDDVTPSMLQSQLSVISNLAYVWPNMTYLRTILNQAMPSAQENQARIASVEAQAAAEASSKKAASESISESKKKAKDDKKSSSSSSDDKSKVDSSSSSSKSDKQ